MSEDTDIIDKTNFDLIEEDEICLEVMKQHPTVFDELQWDEFTLKEKMEKNPFQYQQYRMLWLSQKHKLRKVEILMDEYTGKLYDDLRYKGEKSLSKTEIERYYLPKDERLLKFKRAFMRQSIRSEIYEQIALSFKSQGFAMNAYVKALDT